jgi:hypothetical protein
MRRFDAKTGNKVWQTDIADPELGWRDDGSDRRQRQMLIGFAAANMASADS